MPSTPSLRYKSPNTPVADLVALLSQQFPQWQFVESRHFSWSPSAETIYFEQSHPKAKQLLLHELSHAILGHKRYSKDVELISMELAAWQESKNIAATYGLKIAEETIEEHLSSYRDWLHARSTCPKCEAIGFQINKSSYSCPSCLHKWRVNEARSCALRRYGLKK